MAAHTPLNLLKLWKLEQLPMEMAIGHVLQNLVVMQETIDMLRRTITQLETTSIIAPTQQDRKESMQKSKRNRPSR